MSICIVGAGLAGLSTALKIKERNPEEQVVVVEKYSSASNTQIAGMRLRARKSGEGAAPVEEMVSLMRSRNNGVHTAKMVEFAERTASELEYWQTREDFVGFENRSEWFGPKWGVASNSGNGGWGRSVLTWFRAEAAKKGVQFVCGEAQQILRDEDAVRGIVIENQQESGGFRRVTREYSVSSATEYVLAAGSVAGELFHSTNKRIGNSSHELAFDAGLPLTGSSLHMIHPFGRCDEHGNPTVGCFETDNLSNVTVFLMDGSRVVRDERTTELLSSHQAHYHFPEIAERFRDHGSVVLLQFPDGKVFHARVSHHYYHLGLATEDGVHVQGIRNLSAVGDASSIAYWTENRERFPGFALSKCLVDASIIADTLTSDGSSIVIEPLPEYMPRRLEGAAGRYLRDLNTKYLLDILYGRREEVEATGEAWMRDLSELERYGLVDLSMGIAYSHRNILSGREREPFVVDSTLVDTVRRAKWGEKICELQEGIGPPRTEVPTLSRHARL